MRRFKNLSTMKKLIFGFSAVCAIVAVMGYVGARGTLDVRDNLRVVYADYTVAATDLAKVSGNLMRYRNNMVALQNASDAVAVDRILKEQQGVKQSILDPLDAYAATVLRVSKSGRDEAKDLQAFRAALDGYFVVADVNGQTASAAWSSADPAEAERLRTSLKAGVLAAGENLGTTMVALDELVKTVAEVASDMNAAGEATAARSLWTMVGGTVLTIVVGMTLGVFIARLIARKLNEAVGVLETVAAGDFTVKLDADTKDEVGRMAQALNAAVDAVRTALVEVRNVADGVAAASSQLSSAGEEISSGAQEQASSLEETASSLEEITATVKQNADNAEQANQLAAGARAVAERGGEVVAAAVAGMGEINEASKKIADIITTIDEIAFQTNLLALNAAVEAARAGEQGRGFAVVAGEVRNLAQRSAGAAKEIKGLIGDSVRKVEAGTSLVNKSGETLAEIVGSVKRVTDIVGEIAAASREQAAGIDQVNTAVTQMDTVTQANAAQTEELSGTAEGLSGQARDLQALVAKFNLGGIVAAPRPSVAATTKPVTNKRPAAATRPTARPAARKPAMKGSVDGRASERELDLVGAVAGGSRSDGHFEEF